MIVALMMLAFLVWGYWRLYRGARPVGGTPQVASAARGESHETAVGLEDDAEVWLASHGPWTALDDRQLTRLLTDSAPTPIDDNSLSGEHEDTP